MSAALQEVPLLVAVLVVVVGGALEGAGVLEGAGCRWCCRLVIC